MTNLSNKTNILTNLFNKDKYLDELCNIIVIRTPQPLVVGILEKNIHSFNKQNITDHQRLRLPLTPHFLASSKANYSESLWKGSGRAGLRRTQVTPGVTFFVTQVELGRKVDRGQCAWPPIWNSTCKGSFRL